MMTIEREKFGNLPDGSQIDIIRFSNGTIDVAVLTYGANLFSVKTPDRDGKKEDILLRMETIEDYLKPHPFFGACVGRFANRINNAEFVLDGKVIKVAANDGAHHLHGGIKGFDKVVWEAFPSKNDNEAGVKFSYTSADGEEQYPGKLDVKVTYKLDSDNNLHMLYEAVTDKKTIINLTNHGYWNLTGNYRENILNHNVRLDSELYLPVNETLIPTGEILKTAGTPYDFTSMRKVGDDYPDGGFDHCMIITKKAYHGEVVPFAEVYEEKSGRSMSISTDQAGCHLFTAAPFDGEFTTFNNVSIASSMGMCFETEDFPDAINKRQFPSCILNPGEVYKRTTVHSFSVK